MKILITQGHIVDPSQGIDGIGDIYIEGGKIKEIQTQGGAQRAKSKERRSGAEAPEFQTIDSRGLTVFPGFVDMHVHLREPGFEYKETIRTGTLAAIKGGFTTVCCMPNTNPVNDHASVTEFIMRKAAQEGYCAVLPIGAITKGQKGRELAEIGTMKHEGCIAFSDDGQPVMNSLMMRRALEYSKAFNVPVISRHERRADIRDARTQRHSGGSRDDHGLQGYPAGRADRREITHRPRVDGRIGRSRAVCKEKRDTGNGRDLPALFQPH